MSVFDAGRSLVSATSFQGFRSYCSNSMVAAHAPGGRTGRSGRRQEPVAWDVKGSLTQDDARDVSIDRGLISLLLLNGKIRNLVSFHSILGRF